MKTMIEHNGERYTGNISIKRGKVTCNCGNTHFSKVEYLSTQTFKCHCTECNRMMVVEHLRGGVCP